MPIETTSRNQGNSYYSDDLLLWVNPLGSMQSMLSRWFPVPIPIDLEMGYITLECVIVGKMKGNTSPTKVAHY